MRTKLTVALMMLLFMASIVSIASFATPVIARGPTGRAGNSNIKQLYLVEKNPTDWSVVEGGAWGKMTYNTETGDFVFNGHGLNPDEDYTLVNFARVYPEWPATVNILGAGTPNNGGNIHIKDNYPYADLEFDTTPGSGGTDGYKIWLVLTDDIDAGYLAGWNPTEYLFEDALI